MADEQLSTEILRTLKAIERSMSGMATGFSNRERQRELLKAHGSSRKKMSSMLGGLFGESNISYLEKQRASGEETNESLKNLTILLDREMRLREDERIRPSQLLTSPGEFFSSVTSIGPILGTLSSIGEGMKTRKGKTSLFGKALKTPAAIRNFFKDTSKARSVKDIERKRTDLNMAKMTLDTIRMLREDLVKKKDTTPEGIERLKELKEKESTAEESTQLKGMAFAKAAAKEEERLEEAVYKQDPLLSKRDKEERRRVREEQIADESLRASIRKPTVPISERGMRDVFPPSAPKGPSLPLTKGIFGSFEGGLSGLFNHPIPVSSATPSNFAQAIGGIFYRLGILTEGKEGRTPEEKEKDKGSGFLGGLLGGLGSLLLLRKGIGGLAKGFKLLGTSMLHPIKAMKGLGKLLKSPFGPKKPSLPTRDVAGRFTKATEKGVGKVGSKIATKGVGKGLAKAGTKSVLKKIPFLGAGLGALFAAQRAFSGDFKGAGLELASGATSFLPGAGTAAGFGIDAYLMKRDIDRSKTGEDIGDKEIVARDATRVSQPLKTEVELERDRQTMDIRLIEEAHYRALKRYNTEDLELLGPKRASIQASKNYEETNR